MALKETLNANFKQLKEENKVNNAYLTGQISTEKKMFEQVKEMKHSTFDRSKFEVVGTPTITDDGVASDFSASNYFNTIKLKDLKDKSWKICIKVSLNQSSFVPVYDQCPIIAFGGSWLSKGALTLTGSNSNTLNFRAQTVSGTTEGIRISKSFDTKPTDLYVELAFNITNSTYSLHYDIGNGLILAGTWTPTDENNQIYFIDTRPDYFIRVGNSENSMYFGGSIDLKQFSITVDGVEVFNGNKTGIDQIKKDDYTVVGNPTITADGIASGFDSSNYITSDKNITFTNNNKWEIVSPIATIASITGDSTDRVILNIGEIAPSAGSNGYIMAYKRNSKFGIAIYCKSWSDALTFYDDNMLSVGDTIQAKLGYDGNEYYIYVNHNNSGWVKENFTITALTSAYSFNAKAKIGIYTPNNTKEHSWDGSIDLNSFKIYVDGNLVYQPTLRIPYTQSKTGSKIVDSNYRYRVQDMYEQFGSANYYTLGEDNTTLPMGEVYGMIERNKSYHPNIFETKWSDHLLNDIQWLRGDTFSWQDGNVYKTAYDTLVSEYATGTTETEGSITFKRTTNGFKIATSDMESAILSKYNTDGIAWYYILDTTNKRFKLPRTKFGFEGLRDNVGYDINESLPNIRGGFVGGTWYDTTVGAMYSQGSTTQGANGADGRLNIGFDASRSSSTYQDGAPVQERATQMYLYFYVGEYAREAIEQTAGLNAELFNGKADVNTPSIQAPYLKATFVDGTSGYRIWSDGYCEQWGKSSASTSATGNKVSFVKTFASEPNLVIAPLSSTINETSISAVTTNSFTWFQNSTASKQILWLVKGYLAEGEY